MNRISILVLFFAYMTLSSCDKTVHVSGNITRGDTNAPLDSVRIDIGTVKAEAHGHYKEIDRQIDYTDVNGNYALEVEGKGADYAFLYVSKPGFWKPKSVFIYDKKIIKDYVFYPLDAWMNLHFTNKYNTSKKKIYLQYLGPFQDDTGHPNDYPTIEPQNTYQESFLIPGGQEVTINWDTVPRNTYSFTKTIFCPRNKITDVYFEF
ncbi:MAG: hypothetical protein ACOYPR_02645 [Saprospiraceae bacterium]